MFGIVIGVVNSATAQTTQQNELWYAFWQGIQTDQNGRYVVDSSDNGYNGYVKSADGGAVEMVSDPDRGPVATFPKRCASGASACPTALIEAKTASSGDLNPGSAPFSFGAWVKLQPSDLTGGSNVVQKGLFTDPGGQWKLQIDSPSGEPGRPSCHVRGVIDGQATSVYVEARGADVADGDWHRVVCRKRDTRLAIVVDGEVNNTRDVPTGIGAIANDAPVTVGAKYLGADNDQFHGALDNVFFRILD
jgi:hypothetical protein